MASGFAEGENPFLLPGELASDVVDEPLLTGDGDDLALGRRLGDAGLEDADDHHGGIDRATFLVPQDAWSACDGDVGEAGSAKDDGAVVSGIHSGVVTLERLLNGG